MTVKSATIRRPRNRSESGLEDRTPHEVPLDSPPTPTTAEETAASDEDREVSATEEHYRQQPHWTWLHLRPFSGTGEF